MPTCRSTLCSLWKPITNLPKLCSHRYRPICFCITIDHSQHSPSPSVNSPWVKTGPRPAELLGEEVKCWVARWRSEVLFTSGSGETGQPHTEGLTCNSHCLFFATERNVFAPYLEHNSKALCQFRPLIIIISTFVRAITNSPTIISVTQWILLLRLSKLQKCTASQQHYHSYAAHTVNRVSTCGWRLIQGRHWRERKSLLQ